MAGSTTPPGQRRGQQRRLAGTAQEPHRDDPYAVRHKPSEPSACRECGAVFRDGRWRWAEVRTKLADTICPACHRIRDGFPAGVVTLSGKVVAEHRAEIDGLIRHQEELEKADHPLNRIMATEATAPDTLTITTTDIHLARRLGEAMERAFHGKLALDYDEDGYFLRVDWSRPD